MKILILKIAILTKKKVRGIINYKIVLRKKWNLYVVEIKN